MTKRDTNSGLPQRPPGQTLAQAQAEHQPICGAYEERTDDHKYRCIRNPGHLGEHTFRPENEIVKRLVAKGDVKFTPAGPVVSPPDDDTDPTLVVGNAEVIPAPGGNFSNPTAAARNELAYPSRSIGTVIANSAVDAAFGIPAEVQDETAHAREAVNLLMVGAAEYHRRNQVMPAEMWLDLEGIVAHVVHARGLK